MLDRSICSQCRNSILILGNGRLWAHSVNGQRCSHSGSVASTPLLVIPHSSLLNPLTQLSIPSTSNCDDITTSNILESNPTSNILESNPHIYITNSFIDQFLGLPKPRLISRISRGARQVVSSNYAQCIDRLLKNFSSKDVWSAFLLFGHKSFQIPVANGNSFTRNIKLASSNTNYEPYNIITHTCNKKQDDLNFKV
ncbi:unnamed protein product [Gordionus sp. m RMFG-2023]